MKNYNKIIILCLAGIGDTLLFIPALDEIIKKYKNSKIEVLVMYKSSKQILENSYPNLDIIWFDFINKGKLESLKFVMNLRKNKYDLCVTSYPANRIEYNVIAFLIGAKKRVAHDYFIGNYLLNARFLQTNLVKQNSKKDKYMHNVEENLKLLRLLKMNIVKNPKINLKISKKDIKFSKDFLKQSKISKKNKIIGIHAGTGETKNLHLRR